MSSAYPQEFSKVLNGHTLTPDDFSNVIGTVTRLGGNMPAWDQLRDSLFHNSKTQLYCQGFIDVINDTTGHSFERHLQPNLPNYNDGVNAGIIYRSNHPDEFKKETSVL